VPDPIKLKQWGGTNKKKAGSELDGKHYKEVPQV
jgi:protein gp37